MPESSEGFTELKTLRQEVEDLKAITGALLHAQPDLADRFLRALRSDEAMTRIFLLVDGRRSQNEIAATLQNEGLRGASIGNVSAKFERLSQDLGLIVFDRRERAGRIYRRSPLDAALKISRTLERERERAK